jgi:hypothetical protein
VGTEEKSIQLDLAYLSGLVRTALGNSRLVVRSWQARRLHGGFQLNSSVFRLQGDALEAENLLSWSLVIKTIRPDPDHLSPQDYRYWKREALAYQSGVLNDLSGAVVAPRCYDVCTQPDGSVWLILEDVNAENDASWSLEKYASVARCLGEFNGAYLTGRPLPEATWVAHDWLRDYLMHAAPAVEFIRAHPHDSLIRGVFPGSTLAQILAFWDLHPRCLQALDALPQAFCHQDAFDRNLFLRRGQVLAIDWGYAGKAPVGSELAPLIAAAIGMGNFPSHDAHDLDRACFDAYLEGLSRAGYRPEARQVRLGFTLTLGLRYLLGNTVGETVPALLDRERRKQLFDIAGMPDSGDVKSDPGNVTYYQGIVFELLRQFGVGFAFRLLARTLTYAARLRSGSN